MEIGTSAGPPIGAAVEYGLEDCFDEAFDRDGVPRPLYERPLLQLAELDLVSLKREAQERVAAMGVTFGPGRPLTVDPVPRLIGAGEWDALEPGLTQRARALNRFLADAYGEQRIFAAGLVPRRLLETSAGYEPRMRGLLDPRLPGATVAGFDLVRDGSGRLLVLEDNLRMPSGAAYATALREAVAPALIPSGAPRPLGGFAQALSPALRAAAPEGVDEPGLAIVSDGPGSGAWFEHFRLGRALGAPVVLPEELETDRGRLFARDGRSRRRIDAIYRRLDKDRLSSGGGGATPLGELLLPALESGRLGVVNAFGTGLADDKLAHAYVGAMIRFYLGEEPLLESVATIDPADPAARAAALERPDDLVVKPRDGFGGQGVTILSEALPADRRRAIGMLRRNPGAVVAQSRVPISSHPTVCSGRLRPRRVDLRPFVISEAGRQTAMTGGLSRFAQGAGELVVNSSRGGGGKDTWVVDE
jgi:uncharacterized circularly permuted ATP-grasp superfamily protein